MKHLPNAVTLANLFLGAVALVLAIEGQPQLSAILIAICAVLDFSDGMLARLLNARSELGQQLDSLADLVSFGMAPAGILYHYLQGAVHGLNPQALQNVLPFAAFFLAVFAGLRLAIFNIDTRQTRSFIGLPTPANAAFFASLPFVLAFAGHQGFIFRWVEIITQSWIWLLLLLALFSVLMVAPIPMFSLKIKNLSWQENRAPYIFAALILISLIIFGLQAVALIVFFYLILSLLFAASAK
ncbi:MAG: CDP-alcohol phosphatidyltransferase family protein [Bacteroidales bacterium]|jgi:CDP-diacylglycerol--serine O-phosphatidyltransferase|nr:CDP-alcohol phosphatidyltransferase family protein [Bacteroidales bacterium]NLM92433.1 CDP-diacylglycerol--serine O-phosphatidyltransferase [Bacteroidales bacterium]